MANKKERYFYVTYTAQTGNAEISNGIILEPIPRHPSLQELKELAISLSEFSADENTGVLINNIHEFKTKTDYENFKG